MMFRRDFGVCARKMRKSRTSRAQPKILKINLLELAPDQQTSSVIKLPMSPPDFEKSFMLWAGDACELEKMLKGNVMSKRSCPISYRWHYTALPAALPPDSYDPPQPAKKLKCVGKNAFS